MTKTLIGALAALSLTAATASVALAGDGEPTDPSRAPNFERQVGPRQTPGPFAGRRFGPGRVSPRFSGPGLHRHFVGRRR